MVLLEFEDNLSYEKRFPFENWRFKTKDVGTCLLIRTVGGPCLNEFVLRVGFLSL